MQLHRLNSCEAGCGVIAIRFMEQKDIMLEVGWA